MSKNILPKEALEKDLIKKMKISEDVIIEIRLLLFTRGLLDV